MELLTAISKRLGIETYLEESQFGLLKTTLAIAGKRFVLDVELEADSTTSGEEGDGEGDEMETPAPTPTPGGPSDAQKQASGSGDGGGGRGKVRLAKLMVNHVTKDGGTANSTHIANAIRQGLDQYLTLWNSEDESSSMGEREGEVEGIIKRVWDDMSDLAALDDMSESSERDWFAELEQQATIVQGLVPRYASPSQSRAH